MSIKNKFTYQEFLKFDNETLSSYNIKPLSDFINNNLWFESIKDTHKSLIFTFASLMLYDIDLLSLYKAYSFVNKVIDKDTMLVLSKRTFENMININHDKELSRELARQIFEDISHEIKKSIRRRVRNDINKSNKYVNRILKEFHTYRLRAIEFDDYKIEVQNKAYLYRHKYINLSVYNRNRLGSCKLGRIFNIIKSIKTRFTKMFCKKSENIKKYDIVDNNTIYRLSRLSNDEFKNINIVINKSKFKLTHNEINLIRTIIEQENFDYLMMRKRLRRQIVSYPSQYIDKKYYEFVSHEYVLSKILVRKFYFYIDYDFEKSSCRYVDNYIITSNIDFDIIKKSNNWTYKDLLEYCK